MPTPIYEIIELELSNGQTITVKPLPIKEIKKFMEIVRKTADESIESEDQVMDIFIEAAMHCMRTLKPELSKDKDKFEEVIEIPTMMKILEVAGGLKLNDPNLLGAALVGTN